MNWTLTTLIENHPDPEEKLNYEHGLSILIEGEETTILMDTGQSGAFYDNAMALGKDLRSIDCLVISHAHYDHAGGFLRLVREQGAPDHVYVGKNFFRKAYHNKEGRLKFIGCKFDRKMCEDLRIPVEEIREDSREIAEGVCLHRNFLQLTDYEVLNANFLWQEEEISCGPFGRCMDSLDYRPDIFEDEIAITLETKEGLVVICGCSHPGVMNILKTIMKRTGKRIYGVIGGTHLVEAKKDRVEKTIEELKELGICFLAVSHCTGDKNLAILEESFGEAFLFNCTGNVIKI